MGVPCAVGFEDDEWEGLQGFNNGDTDWSWLVYGEFLTAYRIPAKFDDLDDNGNPTDADIVDRLRFRGDALDMLAADEIERLRGVK
jgi:hypothetical protein